MLDQTKAAPGMKHYCMEIKVLLLFHLWASSSVAACMPVPTFCYGHSQGAPTVHLRRSLYQYDIGKEHCGWGRVRVGQALSPGSSFSGRGRQVHSSVEPGASGSPGASAGTKEGRLLLALRSPSRHTYGFQDFSDEFRLEDLPSWRLPLVSRILIDQYITNYSPVSRHQCGKAAYVSALIICERPVSPGVASAFPNLLQILD